MIEPVDVELAEAVIATAREMGARGINHGRSGNVSTRTATGMLVTPSSVAYDELTPDDVVAVDADGSWRVANDRRPSSEWRFHLDVLAARPEAAAVVHAHPINATALACHRRGIGSFHYMVAMAGGHDIRCADYATFGTPELSANVVSALDGRRACLLANHGVVAIGPSLGAALDLAVEVEVLAGQYLAALAIGEPVALTAAEMDEVLAKMATGAGYG
ncbi:MAG: class II aldolase/adducin family protein, partial [Actinomycetota bacterium]